MLTPAAIAAVAEERIRAALAEGAFDNLPGAGKPLCLEDDAHLPPESRMAYKILKNSGYIADDGSVAAEPAGKSGRSAKPASPIALAAEPARALKASGNAEGRQCSKLRRFAAMFGRVRRARGQNADPALDLALGKALEDSPYFGKVLDKF